MSPQAAPAAEVADVLQIPAFLSRQTDLIVAAAKTGARQHQERSVSRSRRCPPRGGQVVDAGNTRVFVTERGTSFGYHNLVVDMRAFPMLGSSASLSCST